MTAGNSWPTPRARAAGDRNLSLVTCQSKQIYRSGTSIGANVRESKHAQSDADFLSKMSIAYKEADETDFWLNLLHDNGYLNDDQFKSLEKDITRILKILTSIVKTMRTKLGLEKSWTMNNESWISVDP